jgi:hypothetical protein
MSRFMIVILGLVLIPIFLFAQDPLSVGSKYIDFEINRMPFISGGYFLQDNFALEAGVGFAFDGEINSNGLGIKLGLDKYIGGDRLSPFVGGYSRFEINPNALGQTFWKGSRIIFGGHWGLNLFLLKNLSIAGSVGAEFQINSPKDEDSSSSFSTFTSGVKVRFFF